MAEPSSRLHPSNDKENVSPTSYLAMNSSSSGLLNTSISAIRQQSPSSDSDVGMPSHFVAMTETPSDLLKRASSSTPHQPFTTDEIDRIRVLLRKLDDASNYSGLDSQSLSSEYPEFTESTHAWAVFADNPDKRASKLDRFVGTLIIAFQLFTYWIFAAEAIEDYTNGIVPVLTTHDTCIATNQSPDGGFWCEAEITNNADAFVAFFMLGIFLTADFQQAGRAILDAPRGSQLMFACLAGIEVVCAFIAASISISQKLYIGEVTDAVEVGVGLLFIRELSTRAYHGISNKKTKRYKQFFSILSVLIVIGVLSHPVYEALFAP